MYKLNGVFEVRETPKRTKSASRNPRGSLPSSYFTANSIAATRLKYAWFKRCKAPGSWTASTPNVFSSIVVKGDIKSTYCKPVRLAKASTKATNSLLTKVVTTIDLSSKASLRISPKLSSSLVKGKSWISERSIVGNCAETAAISFCAVSPTESEIKYIRTFFIVFAP